jgi:hypothetical protein
MKTGTLKLAFYCTVLFVSGMAVGALSHRYYVQDLVSAQAAPRRGPEQYRRDYMAEMTSRLKLTPEQTQHIEAILDDMRNKYRALREQQRPHEKTLQEEQTSRITALLTDEQKAEYERMRIEREERRKAFEAKRKAEEEAAKNQRSQQAPPTR